LTICLFEIQHEIIELRNKIKNTAANTS